MRSVARRALAWPLVAAAAVALSGCADDNEAPATVGTRTETTVETTSPPPTTTHAPSQPKPRTIVIVVDQGRPRGGIKRPTLEKGEKVVLVIRADVGDEVHIHGHETTTALTPGKPARIPLTTTLAGRFEVELHHPDSLLAVLEVRP